MLLLFDVEDLEVLLLTVLPVADFEDVEALLLTVLLITVVGGKVVSDFADVLSKKVVSDEVSLSTDND
ncbi:hypothetical protein SDC9_155629 [bioreactor metagenome]|uniref:Uncharacterized protein n=1 Tax=bioreactor metagenome TaxID=1076179 RepID=A0A645F2A8_9ZZZZ